MHYTMVAPGGKNSLRETAGVRYGRLGPGRKIALSLPGGLLDIKSEKRICPMQISKRGCLRARV